MPKHEAVYMLRLMHVDRFLQFAMNERGLYVDLLNKESVYGCRSKEKSNNSNIRSFMEVHAKTLGESSSYKASSIAFDLTSADRFIRKTHRLDTML